MSDLASAPAVVEVDEATESARLIAQIANDFKGRDTLILDMRKITPIVDFFVITTMTNTRQMRAMGDEVVLLLKKRGIIKRGSEGGEGDSVWTLHDFGDVVLHAFSEDGRALYDLEGLWADAPRTEVRGSQAVPSVPMPLPAAQTDDSDSDDSDSDDSDSDDSDSDDSDSDDSADGEPNASDADEFDQDEPGEPEA